MQLHREGTGYCNFNHKEVCMIHVLLDSNSYSLYHSSFYNLLEFHAYISKAGRW